MTSVPLRPLSRLARSSLRESSALLALLGLIAGITLAGQQAGSAATPVSQSNGTFLGGSVLGSSLSNLVSVAPAGATNTGGAADVKTHPLDVTALNALEVSLGDGVNLFGGSGVLKLGAVTQYAEAKPDGSSRAASGALTDSGAIAVDGSDDFPADATFELSELIGPALSDALADVSLSTGALSASAAQTVGGTQTGDYRIAGLTLNVTSPLVEGLTTGLRSTLADLQPVVDGLPDLIKALPLVGSLASVTGVPKLTDIVDELGSITSLDGSIKANLHTGTISIDLAAALKTLGLDLNQLDPGTQLLPYVTQALTTQLLPAITTALTGLTTKLTAAINGISVTVGGLPVSTAVLAPVLNPAIAQLLAPVNALVARVGDAVVTPLAEALTDLLSLQANVQETSDGRFTERALRVGLLPAASPAVAVLDLASATVGPNAGPAAPAVPTTSGLSPDHGPAAGGQTVTVTGTGFVPGSTTVTIGGNTVPATVTDSTTLTFPTPAHAPGDVTVTVTTPAGTSGGLPYTYDPAGSGAPTTSGLSPDHGPAAGGQTVTVTGTGFVPGSTTVTIGGNTVPAGSVTVTDSTTLTFPTPAHPAGDVTVTVTTPGGTSGGLPYTYDPAAAVVPSTSAVDPDHGPSAGGQTVTVTGTGFVPGSTTVTIGGTTVPAGSVTVTGSTTLTFPTPAHPAGDVTVTVTTPGGTSGGLPYTYDPAAAVVPSTSAVDPDHGPSAGGQTVTVTGTGFVPGSTTVTIGGTTVPAGSVIVTGSTTLTFPTPAHAAGDVTVTVTTPGGTTAGLPYTYDAASPTTPSTRKINPDHGPTAGGQTVTITGTGFVPGSTSVTIGGVTVPPARVTVVSPTRLQFTTPQHAPGQVRVTVTTDGGTSAPLAYTYETSGTTSPPTITNPADGSTTTDPTPVVDGTGTPGNLIEVTENGRTLCTTVVRNDGSWSCKSGALSSGAHRIVSTETTQSGGMVGRSEIHNFDVNPVTTSGDGSLATTGLAITSMTVLALVLAAAGVLLVLVSRRRAES